MSDPAPPPPPEAAPGEPSPIELIRQLLDLFKFERMAHLTVTCLMLVILLVCAVYTLRGDPGDFTVLGGFFAASGGLVTYTAGRLLRMWDQALQVVARHLDEEDDALT